MRIAATGVTSVRARALARRGPLSGGSARARRPWLRLVLLVSTFLLLLGFGGAVAASASAAPPSITGTVGVPLSSATADLTGMTGPVVLSIAPALPDGLTFDGGTAGTPGVAGTPEVPATADTPGIPAVPEIPAIPAVAGTGVISGTPTSALAPTAFTISATDGAVPPVTTTVDVTLTIDGTLTAPAPLSLTVGDPLDSSSRFVPHDLGAGIAYSAVSAPAWLSIASDGSIIGTPDAASPAATVDVVATDGSGARARSSFILEVLGALPTPHQSVSALVGTALTQPTVAFPAVAPGGYEIAPDVTADTGLVFEPTTGAVSGTPTKPHAAVTYSVRQRLTVGGPVSARATITVSIDAVLPSSPLTITGMVGTPLSPVAPHPVAEAIASGLVAPFAYSVAPALPDGLLLDPGTGIISGTPTAALASGRFTISVVDANGARGTGTMSASILGQLVPKVHEVTGRAGLPLLSSALTASGWTAPLRFTITPALPAGLVLSTSTGVVSGTARAVMAATSFEITGTDAKGVSGRAQLTITVTQGVLSPPVVATVIGGLKPGSIQVYFARPSLAPVNQAYEVIVSDANRQQQVASRDTASSPLLIEGLTPGATYWVVVAARATDSFERAESAPRSGRATAASVVPTSARPASTSASVAVAQRAVLAQNGLTLAQGRAARTAKRVVVKLPPTAAASRAPVARIPAGLQRRIVLTGVQLDGGLRIRIKIAGGWSMLGTRRVDAKHQLTLPAFAVARTGSYLVQITPLNGRSLYVTLMVKPRVDLGG